MEADLREAADKSG